MNMSDAEDEYNKIAERTNTLIEKINDAGGRLDPIYYLIKQAINQYENAGHDINELIPTTAGGSGLGFSLLKDKGRGKAFLNTYFRLVKDDLCGFLAKHWVKRPVQLVIYIRAHSVPS